MDVARHQRRDDGALKFAQATKKTASITKTDDDEMTTT
jgi:hypothetical protein